MKQTHTHTKSKKREKKRESVLILTENKEQKNEREILRPNFVRLFPKKYFEKYFEHHQILSLSTKSKSHKKEGVNEGEFQPESSATNQSILAFCGIRSQCERRYSGQLNWHARERR